MSLHSSHTNRAFASRIAVLLGQFLLAALVAGSFVFTTTPSHASTLNRQSPAHALSPGGYWADWMTSAFSPGDSQITLLGAELTTDNGGNPIDYNGLASDTSNGSSWSGWSRQPDSGTGNISTPTSVSLASGATILLQTNYKTGRLDENIGSAAPVVWSGWSSINTGGFPLLSNPGAVSWGGSRVDAFAWVNFIGATLWHAWSNDGGKHWNWQLLFGIANVDSTKAPVVVSHGTNQLDLFANALNTGSPASGGLFYENWNGWVWSNWQNLGGALVNYDPAHGDNPYFGGGSKEDVPDYTVASLSSNQLSIFGTWSDRTLRVQTLTGTTWSGWQSLGGILTSSPTATSWAYASLSVCALGLDHALWCLNDVRGAWENWYSLGGNFYADSSYGGATPVSISSSSWSIDVFAQAGGSDFSVWHRQGTFDSTCDCLGWDAWESLGWP